MSIGGQSKIWQPVGVEQRKRTRKKPSSPRISVNVSEGYGFGRYNMGVFDSVNGDYSLTYMWPDSPWTSYSTVIVNGYTWYVGEDMVLIEGDGLWNVSGTFQSSNSQDDVSVIGWTWTDYYPFDVRRTITTVPGRATFKYEIINNDTSDALIGLRIMFDAQINYWDDSMFIVNGVGPSDARQILSGSALPNRFQVVGREWPTDDRMCYAIIRGHPAPDPDYVKITAWSDVYSVGNGWYDPTYYTPANPIGDSAWSVYFDEAYVAPGATRTCITAVSLE